MFCIEMQRMRLDRIAVRRAGEVLRGAGEIDEGVESLVRPRIQPLVGADDHRKPFVSELVRQRPLLVFALFATVVSLSRAARSRALSVGVSTSPGFFS